MPPPLYPGFDTLGTLEYITKTGDDYTWFVLNARIIEKEFALSGQEQNPDLTGQSVRRAAAPRVRSGRAAAGAGLRRPGSGLRQRGFVARVGDRDEQACPTWCRSTTTTVEAEVTARDREVANRFTKDGQITAIRGARGYLGDRLSPGSWRRTG